MADKPRWCIRIQRRAEYNGHYARDDWRAYRDFIVWPLTFHTAKEAQIFMESCFTFKGLEGRKMSASVCRCGVRPTKLRRGDLGGSIST